jgi:hypothetical protein
LNAKPVPTSSAKVALNNAFFRYSVLALGTSISATISIAPGVTKSIRLAQTAKMDLDTDDELLKSLAEGKSMDQ